jgi:hypothetical protein
MVLIRAARLVHALHCAVFFKQVFKASFEFGVSFEALISRPYSNADSKRHRLRRKVCQKTRFRQRVILASTQGVRIQRRRFSVRFSVRPGRRCTMLNMHSPASPFHIGRLRRAEHLNDNVAGKSPPHQR